MPQNSGAAIYNYIAVTIEFIVDFLDLFSWLYVLLCAALRRSYDCLCTPAAIEKRERQTLEHCRALLTKKPRHIAIIVGPTARFIHKSLFERLFRYALQMDIACISVYDTRPDVSRKESSSLLGQVTTPTYVHREHISKRHYRWSTTMPTSLNGEKLHKAAFNGGHKNGHVQNGSTLPHRHEPEKTLEIFEFSTHDNFEPLIEVCRELFAQRDAYKTQLLLVGERDYLTQSIDEELTKRIFGNISKTQEFSSEPELCIVFNAFLCTYRFLPWHTRFTEFYNYKTGINFNADTFADLLYNFSRCEQRWGK